MASQISREEVSIPTGRTGEVGGRDYQATGTVCARGWIVSTVPAFTGALSAGIYTFHHVLAFLTARYALVRGIQRIPMWTGGALIFELAAAAVGMTADALISDCRCIATTAGHTGEAARR